MRRVAAVLAVVVGVDADRVHVRGAPLRSFARRADDRRSVRAAHVGEGAARPEHGLRRREGSRRRARDLGGAETATGARDDDAQFEQYVAEEMPGIAKFDAQAPGVVALVGPVIGKMEAVRGDYTKASDIPVSWLAAHERAMAVPRYRSAARRRRRVRAVAARARSRASRCCSSASASRSPRR